MAEVRIRALRPEVLTEDRFRPFGIYAAQPGRSPDWLASGRRVGGVREARVASGPRVAELWNLGDLSFEEDTPYVGFVRYFHQGFRVSELERHRHESQTWVALDGVSFLVVAPASGSGNPSPSSVEAFIVNPGDMIAIGPGVWMCHFFPVGSEATFNVITARREPEQDRDLVEFMETAGTVFEVQPDDDRAETGDQRA